MLPISWQGSTPLRYIDALFTATSAVCVTGLITVDTALYTMFGQFVILLLIQFGGLGIITFTTLFVALPRRKISLVNRSIIKDYYIDEIESEPKNIIKHILFVTLALESLGAFFLYLGFSSTVKENRLFVSIFHSVSAFCNAGFSTFSRSLLDYKSNPIILITIMILIVSGGLGFLVMQDIGKIIIKKKHRLSTYSKIVLKMTFFLIVIGAVLFFFSEWDFAMKGFSYGERILASFFQAITPRTAGYEEISQAALSPLGVLATIFLMFIGGASGSIAGGIKINTFFIILMASIRGLDENNMLCLKNRSIGTDTIIKAFSILVKAMIVVLVAVFLIIIFETNTIANQGKGIIEIIYEVVSAFATVGLSMGITFKFSDPSKLVLVFVMFFGRIGIVTMVWPLFNKKIERYTDFPRTTVMLG